ncbi:DNA-binding response regulator in two-component regulatory system with CusS [Alteromonas sp. 38]|uniref:response regulator transcription factor n=1 Tax=Alteromonas TaxID=226 RepID=UPI0012F1B2F4|nr:MULTISPECIES: response regulator transcription factor [Alteromonas]CAD5261921.1 DNA-binding response regulator in two-component regulatory system with CusS [Alteromonas sp. 154]VXC26605.1 DNA-binding response regulator in two-component regulatory system with CusS [Alteromonas sp. 38]
MNVLLVEDDPKVAAHIEKGFIGEGHSCIAARDGEKGLAEALSEDVDVIVLDVMLPLLDGFTILERLRNDNVLTPVLLLSAKSQVEDKVRGLRSGANDYLTKPFAFEELLARVEGLAGRERESGDKTLIKVGDLTLDLVNRKVQRGDTEIDLQSKEFQLLECLLRHQGKVVTRSMLLEQVWNYHFDPQTNVIDVHISRLRQKVDKAFNVPLIETVRGTGYRIADPVVC